MRSVLYSILLVLIAVPLAAEEKHPLATQWTVLTTIDACALAQAGDVQKEVQISDNQAKELKVFVDTWRKRAQEFQKANKRASADAWDDQYRALLAAAHEIVSPDQLNRLRQIHFQCEGIPGVVLNHEQTSELFKISREQKGRLAQIQVENGKKRADAFTKRMEASKTPFDVFKSDAKEETLLLEEMNKEALAVLNERQRESWTQLIGKPFKGRLVDAKGKKVHPRLDAL